MSIYLQVVSLSLVCLAALTTGHPCNAPAPVPCNCGLGPGYSVHETAETKLCHASDHKLVIRPDPYVSPAVKEKYESNTGHRHARLISGGSVYPPAKDYVSLCSCSNTIVTPAKIPAPPCRKCDPFESSHSGGNSIFQEGHAGSSSIDSHISDSFHHSSHHSSHHSHHSHHGQHCNHGHHGHYHDRLSHIPADPVSIAIAVKQQIENQNVPRNSIADRDISFGFQKLPVEVTREYAHNRVNEGNINAIRGQVLELKLPKPTVTKSVDEEAYEDLLAQQEDDLEESSTHQHVRKPSLSDLGYINARTTEQKFVDLKVEQKRVCGLEAAPQCDDGFRPGKVILREEVKQPNYSIKERETICAGGEHHKCGHAWSGHSNIIKHIGARHRFGCSCSQCVSGCNSGCH